MTPFDARLSRLDCSFILSRRAAVTKMLRNALPDFGLAGQATLTSAKGEESGLGDSGKRLVLLLRDALCSGESPAGEAGRIAGATERGGRAALAAARGQWDWRVPEE